MKIGAICPNKAKPQTAREDRVHTPKLEGRAAVPGYEQELMAMEAPFFSPERTAGRREGEPPGRLVGDHLQLRGPPPSALLSARLEPAPEPRIPRFNPPYFDRVHRPLPVSRHVGHVRERRLGRNVDPRADVGSEVAAVDPETRGDRVRGYFPL